uniref:Secreted protein n=1 Tax=Oryza sativa subsp. japonica TaxID=39947 RepID=Q5VPL9_ORYSJ|nr:hypothetical protein [Oryza sativa Japonica Group]
MHTQLKPITLLTLVAYVCRHPLAIEVIIVARAAAARSAGGGGGGGGWPPLPDSQGEGGSCWIHAGDDRHHQIRAWDSRRAAEPSTTGGGCRAPDPCEERVAGHQICAGVGCRPPELAAKLSTAGGARHASGCIWGLGGRRAEDAAARRRRRPCLPPPMPAVRREERGEE